MIHDHEYKGVSRVAVLNHPAETDSKLPYIQHIVALF